MREIIFGLNNLLIKNECLSRMEEDLNDNNIEEILLLCDDTDLDDIKLSIKKSNIIDKDMKLKVYTLDKFAARYINNYGDKRLTMISDEQAKVIITHAIFNILDKLKLYTNINQAFIDKAINTIFLLKQNCITPDELEFYNTLNKDLAIKIEDIHCIYQEYEKLKQGSFLDKYDKINYFSSLIKDNNDRRSIYLYKNINLKEYELKAISNITYNHITVCVNADDISELSFKENNHFFKSYQFVYKLIRHLNLTLNSFKITHLNKKAFLSDELNMISTDLYKHPFSTYTSKTSDIFVLEAETMHEEISMLADILKQYETKHNSISITVRSINDYKKIIHREFSKRNIPYWTQESIAQNTQPILKILKILLNDNLNIKKYLAMLKTFYFNIDINTIYIFEKYIIEQEKLEVSLEDLNLKDLDLGLTHENIEKLMYIFNSISEVKISSNKKGTFKDYISVIFEFLEKMELLKEIQDNINFELNKNEISITKVSWDQFIHTLNIYMRTLKTEIIDYAEFLLLFNRILDDTVQLKIESNNGICITELNNTKGGDILFLIGTNKDISLVEQNNTLLSDDDILSLNKHNLLIGEDCISKYLEERFSIYSLLSKASEKIFISYPLIGTDLSNKDKADFIDRLQTIFTKLSYGTSCNNMVHNGTLCTATNEHIEIAYLGEFLRSLEKETKLKYISKLEDNLNQNKFSASIIDGAKYNNDTKCNNVYLLKDLYFSDFISVSKLEKFAKCPFSYFAEYGLKLKKAESVKLKTKDIGIVIHSIFEDFDKYLKSNNIAWSSVTDKLISSTVDSITENYKGRDMLNPFLSEYSSTYYLNRFKEVAISSLKAIRSHIGHSFYEILGHEIQFSSFSRFNPITIRLQNGQTLKLQGQIDRLDILNTNTKNYLRIVDYKTGNTCLDFTDLAAGTQLQLFTYLDAILSSIKDTEVAGIFYFKADDPLVKATPYTPEYIIRESIQKELKLNGLFLNDESVVKKMDKGLFDGDYNSSINIKAQIKMDGNLSKTTPGLSLDEFYTLKDFIKLHVEHLAFDMLINCNTNVKPIKKKTQDNCKYCTYKEVCHFDETLTFNNFKILKEVKRDDLIKIASEKVGEIYE